MNKTSKKEVESIFLGKKFRGYFARKVSNEIDIRKYASEFSDKMIISEVVYLAEDKFYEFKNNLLNDYDFLKGKGGVSCDLDFQGKDSYYDLTEEEQEIFNENAYIQAIVVTDGITAVISNPEGFSYSRYSCQDFYEEKEKIGEINMKMFEFLEKNDFDGELLFNGLDFSDTCSFCFSKTKPSLTAIERYSDILNAEYIETKDGYAVFENKELKDIDEAFSKAEEFLNAISGYISDALYQEYFPTVE